MTTPLVTLVCLAHAGSSALHYLRWRALLPAHVTLKIVERTGRGSRLDEPLCADFDAVLEDAWQQLQPMLGSPVVLFGHSLGGLIAVELARRAQRHGQVIQALFVSASTAPTRRDDQAWANLDDAGLLQRVARMGGLPAGWSNYPEWQAQFLSVLRADGRVCASYRPQMGRLDCPIFVLAGRDDQISALDLLAWSVETHAMCQVQWFAGGHFYDQQQPRAVVDHVLRCIADVDEALLC